MGRGGVAVRLVDGGQTGTPPAEGEPTLIYLHFAVSEAAVIDGTCTRRQSNAPVASFGGGRSRSVRLGCSWTAPATVNKDAPVPPPFPFRPTAITVRALGLDHRMR
jgi:hypothetical protein